MFLLTQKSTWYAPKANQPMIFKLKTNESCVENGKTRTLSLLIAGWADSFSASLDEEMTSEETQDHPQRYEETLPVHEDSISDIELTRKCLRAAVQLGNSPTQEVFRRRYSVKSGFAKKCTGKASLQACSRDSGSAASNDDQVRGLFQ